MNEETSIAEKELVSAEKKREKKIVKTSVIGIIANIFLAAFKAVIGLISSSVAVVLDAVNNLSDALSSVITIIGTKLASRKPDKKHPLGHGRIEYLTSMIIAAIVLYAGITAAVESIKKIIEPQTPDYSVWSLVIIGAAVVVKIILGQYVKSVGKKVNSGSLIASGSDAMFDAILSASVFVSAVIFMISGVSLEAYVGVLIAAFIIKSGVGMIIETIGDILGKRADAELVAKIKKTICEDPDALGAYDLYLYNYGPESNYGSVHVEINDTMTAEQIDAMMRRIQYDVYVKHGVILTGIGIYAVNTGNDEIKSMRRRVVETVMAHDYSMQIHGFFADTQKKMLTFDVVLSFECDRDAAIAEICSEVKEMFPDYTVNVQPDIDV